MLATKSIRCANCDALYQAVRAEPGPQTIDREIRCEACGGPLPARDGKFILKYFLWRKAARRQRPRGRRAMPVPRQRIPDRRE